MILSDGKNNYANNTFAFWEWSAPVLQTPEDVFHALHELKLQGRIIQDIRSVGMGYNWRKDDIWEAIHRQAEGQYGKARATEICHQKAYPNDISLNRWAEIDEPTLIKFIDGDILGISFDEGSCVRLSLNTIPWDIQPGINPLTFHANRLFKDIIEKTIASIEVSTVQEKPDFTGSHGLHLGEQPAYLSKIAIYYGDGGIVHPLRSMVFEPFYDYGNISLIDDDKSCCEICASEVAYLTEGY